jgi:hypothetical protein
MQIQFGNSSTDHDDVDDDDIFGLFGVSLMEECKHSLFTFCRLDKKQIFVVWKVHKGSQRGFQQYTPNNQLEN